jgi:hypothetical protein
MQEKLEARSWQLKVKQGRDETSYAAFPAGFISSNSRGHPD